MSRFMNTYIKCMAGESTSQIGYQKYNPPGCISEKIGKNHLKCHAKQYNPKSPWIPSDQCPDFRMFMNNFLCSRLMRLTLHTPPETVRLLHIAGLKPQI